MITSSSASATPITVNLTAGGTAGQGVVTPPSSVTLAAGATQASVSVQTRATTTVAANQTIVLSIAGGTGYTVGTPGSAQTTIKNDNVPALTITGSTTVTPGAAATLTVTANQAPLQNLQVALTRRRQRPGRHGLSTGQPGRDARRRDDDGHRHGRHASPRQ